MLNRIKLFLVILTASGLGLGFVAPMAGYGDWQSLIWGLVAGIVLAFLYRDIVTSLWRGEFGLDMVAALSMTVALFFGETLAAAVVALMYSGGQMLEDFAETRALSEMKALLGRVPKTALRYLDLLEQTFAVRTLPSWSNNAVKRLVKAPKLHFVDTGLAAHLVNCTAEKLTPEKGPFGPLLESFVLGELDKQNRWSEGRYSFSHFRDKDGAEVDIVVENHEGRIAGVEIKAAATVGRRDFAGLTKLAAAAGDRFAGGVVLYDGEQSLPFGEGKRAVPISALWAPNKAA